jgi:hypothetical protein
MPKLASRFVELPPERRALALAQAAARTAASSVMVEKDFWVCWLLGLFFADVELAPHLVFKGARRHWRGHPCPGTQRRSRPACPAASTVRKATCLMALQASH